MFPSRRRLRLRARARSRSATAIDPQLLLGLGYGAPYEWAHYDRRAVPAAGKAAREPSRADHHGGALPAGQGRPGSGRALQRGGQVLRRLLRRYGEGPRPAHLARRRSTASTRRPRTAAPGFRCRRCARAAGAGRIGAVAPHFHGAPTNRSHRTTLEVDCPEIVAPLPGRRRRRRDARAQLPRLPPDVSLAARSWRRRHPDRGHGLRQGHRRARRRAALPVQRFPARQRGGPAARSGIAGLTLELALRVLETAPGSAHHGAVAAALERRPDWKLDYSNIDRLSAEEIARRRAEFDRQKQIAKAKLADDMRLKGAAE